MPRLSDKDNFLLKTLWILSCNARRFKVIKMYLYKTLKKVNFARDN
jgi:hypothetical protein